MILQLNYTFEGFTPLELTEKNEYREVYRAEDKEGKEISLLVYDVQALPEYFENGVIPELEIITQHKKDVFPQYIASGKYDDGYKKLKWVAYEHINGITLTDLIKSGTIFEVRETLVQFCRVIAGVKEISKILRGGAHNNINTDSIIVTTDCCDEKKWYLTGLNCASFMSKGKAYFDESATPYDYKAPETWAGIYNQQTDIFALGIVLAFILQGEHPWKDFIYREPYANNKKQIARMLRSTAPVLNIDDKLKDIVDSAISSKLNSRFKNIDDFGYAIMKFLGNDSCGEFEHSVPTMSNKPSSYDSGNKDKENKYFERLESFAPQPKIKIEINELTGNGFKDVAGMCDLKYILSRNFTNILANRDIARQFEITPPNGILLWGPPGTGKTYISRRLGEETGMLYSLILPSDLGNIYQHGSQSMIADLFNKAFEKAKQSNKGVLLVFDEFDTIVPRRNINSNSNNTADEVGEFLTQLNNCAEKNVYVIATTNRINAIDPAILRKGRIDEIIYVGLPDEEARKELIEMELKKRPHDDINTERIVQLTKGYTASDISFIIKECARCSFAESIKANKIINISQNTIEMVISNTRPSVTEEQIKEYEKTREEFSKGTTQKRPHIGFR